MWHNKFAMMDEKLIKHWVDGSDKNFDDMNAIFKKAGRCDWALYIGHLCLEKLLKAIYVKVTEKPEPPYIHNLVSLAKKCNLELTDERVGELNTVNSFCIESKYDDQKLEFYKRCTREYTVKSMKLIKELRQWLKEELI